jgi:hypothetical protein
MENVKLLTCILPSQHTIANSPIYTVLVQHVVVLRLQSRTKTCIKMYAFLWVIPQRLNFICRRFGTLCLFHLHRRVGTKND